MKFKYMLTTLALCATACITEPDGGGTLLATGDAMPQFEVTTLDGQVLNTAYLSKRECAIVFFNTTCPDCRHELPIVQASADAEPEVFYLCISRQEGPEAVAAYWAEAGLTMAVSAQTDRTVYSLFATEGIPRLYRFNAQGKLVEQSDGQ